VITDTKAGIIILQHAEMMTGIHTGIGGLTKLLRKYYSSASGPLSQFCKWRVLPVDKKTPPKKAQRRLPSKKNMGVLKQKPMEFSGDCNNTECWFLFDTQVCTHSEYLQIKMYYFQHPPRAHFTQTTNLLFVARLQDVQLFIS